MKRVIRKAQWHRMEAYFDGPSQVVTQIGEADVLLQGTLYETSVPCPKCGARIGFEKMRIRHEVPQRKELQAKILDKLAPLVDGAAEVVDWIMGKVLATAWSLLDLSPQLGICTVPKEAISNAQGEALRRMLEANLRQPVLLLTDNIHMVQLRAITQPEADRVLKEGEAHVEEEGRVVSIKGGHRSAKPKRGEGSGEGSGGRPADDPGPAGPGAGPGGQSGPVEGPPEQGSEGGSGGPAQPPPEAVEGPQG